MNTLPDFSSTTPFFDCHCHLDDEAFTNLNEVLAKAKEHSLKYIMTSGYNFQSSINALALKKNHHLLCSLGSLPPSTLEHPQKEPDSQQLLEIIRSHAKEITAIGEIGMDFKFSNDLAEQQKWFTQFLELAHELRKPVVIHSRQAEAEVIELLQSYTQPVIMHCFGGKKKLLSQCGKHVYFSIPPSITRSSHFQSMAQELPLNKLLTETDAPYLSADKDIFPNTPDQVRYAAAKIAEIKALDPDKTAQVMFKSFCTICNLNND